MIKAPTLKVLAFQLNIKVSTAKKLLEELMEQRVLSLASRSHILKVYALAADLALSILILVPLFRPLNNSRFSVTVPTVFTGL